MTNSTSTACTMMPPVQATWANDVLRATYVNIATSFDFHIYCNRYGTFKHLGDITGLAVLEVPSGPGIYARALLEKGAASVTSVDLSEEYIALCEQNVASMFEDKADAEKRWRGLAANACVPKNFPGAPFDVARANFILENFSTRAEIRDFAKNVYDSLRPGGRYVGIWAIGAHKAEDLEIVRNITGMETDLIHSALSPGDTVSITYADRNACGGENISQVFQWHYWTEEILRRCLEEVGFSDVRFERLLVDPAYRGQQDLQKLVHHLGNRHVLAVKPSTASMTVF